jgi:beta-galactosidase/beta-glucuronidase
MARRLCCTKEATAMPLGRAIAPLILMLPAAASSGQVEKPPPEAPIMTRWAAEVSPDRVHPEYPRPQLVRDEWLNLNGVWELAIAEDGDDLSDPPVRALEGHILVPFPVGSALSGVTQQADRVWYRRTFEFPGTWRDRRILLHFGAVDWHARVWVNGQLTGEHRGGYDAFTLDITDALNNKAEQELIVGVWDPTDAGTQPRGKQVRQPKGIWYTPSTGIWQTVWLEPVPPRRLDRVELISDVDNSRLRVKLPGARLSRSDAVDVVVFDEGREIARASGLYEIDVPIEAPRLWSPDDPFLYDVEITLRWWNDPTRVHDRVRSYFGMRSIDVGPDDSGTMRLRLNGKPLFQIGTLDQGFWPDGLYTAPTDEALRYDIEITKRLGFNAIRKHVKVEPDRWYYWCDRAGLLVWQDMPSGDAFTGDGRSEITRSPESAARFERELTRLIEGRSNHPCIVTWVLFNEGWGQYDTARLTELIRTLDPTRPVDSASGWNDLKTGDVNDVHSYPGPACPPVEPTRAAVLGEFGGLGLPVEGHTWTDNAWGYRSMPDADALNRRYE